MFRIKEILKEKNMTMAELSEKLGIHRVTLSQNLTRNPTVDTLQKIADALEVPLASLFTNKHSDMTGFVEYKGIVYKINSFEDLKNLLLLEKTTAI
ncbi:helix-turn-helix transcriptional regulator [Capnocytophaga canimorsus]|nr:helix-turn-helix transcriptional regulator [Capnocytophaga canimorsus]WGU68285.1 helix-turn-helix transcriptional regulator [Capnocytophaga canimorsus]WGU70613.1 helix-turn-helix transcriptional regulator [Capnocytophaga canimorsus]